MVTIDESGTEGKFFVWLRFTVAYLQFKIDDLGTIRNMSQFLCSAEKDDRCFELQECLGGVLAFIIHDGGISIRLTTPDTQMFNIQFDACEAAFIARAIDDAVADVE